MSSAAIIIPCYNEAARLKVDDFIQFLNEWPDFTFFFVDDGSTDNTLKILRSLAERVENAQILSLPRNGGKGEAVRSGFKVALLHPFSYVGYCDADLSTPLTEMVRFRNLAQDDCLNMVIGSRIQKADTVIKRSFGRHLIGRAIATLIDYKFRLGVYDTQCGAKLLSAAAARAATEKPFLTRWFFDVEIMIRLRHLGLFDQCAEMPLRHWQNELDSKLGWRSVPAVLRELRVLLSIAEK